MFSNFKRIIFFLALCIALFSNISYSLGQEVLEKRHDISLIANLIYRTDDRLINGKYYSPKHYGVLGTPYFKSDSWLNGTLFIKGIKYVDIPVKYNIEDDNFLINFSFKNNTVRSVVLYNAFVDSVKINSEIFHNTEHLPTTNSIGIAELIYKGDSVSAYFKHSIEFLGIVSIQSPNGRYLDPRKKLYFLKKSTFIEINSKKAFLAHFKSHKKEIRLFMRKNQIYFKKATTSQLNELLSFIEGL